MASFSNRLRRRWRHHFAGTPGVWLAALTLLISAVSLQPVAFAATATTAGDYLSPDLRARVEKLKADVA